MTEYHDYNERNINMCKTCKHIHDLNKDEEGQIEDYHPIVENKKHNKSKKRKHGIPATLADLANKNIKIKTKPGPPPNSQLDWYEVDYSESDNSPSSSKSSSKSNSRKSNKSTSSKSSSRKKKRTARDATLADLARGAKIRTKPGLPPNSQLDWYKLADSESDNSRSKDSNHRGGKNKSKKNKSKNNKK